MTTKQQKTYEPIPDLEGEVWKPIKRYEGLYQVSNMGRVKKINYRGSQKDYLLKPHNIHHGYMWVNLYKDGKAKGFAVHRLVYTSFYGDIQSGFEINHKNENSSDNRLINLEAISHRDNVNYGSHNKRVSEKLKNGSLSKIVYQYSLDGVLVKIWPSAEECGRNGFCAENITTCCRGIRFTSDCFIWSYNPLKEQDCKNLIASKKHNNKKRRVYQYTLQGDFVRSWESASETYIEGFFQQGVNNCCNGKTRQHHGYIWSYEPIENK